MIVNSNQGTSGHPSLHTLCALQDMIESGDIRRAQRTIESHLKSQSKSDNILLKCLNAMCLVRMGQIADGVAVANDVVSSFPVIRDTTALGALALVYSPREMRDVYRRAWEADSKDAHIGVLYAQALYSSQHYADFQDISISLYQISSDLQYQLWNVLAKLKQSTDSYSAFLVTLATKTIEKLSTSGKFKGAPIRNRIEVALMYMYGLSLGKSTLEKLQAIGSTASLECLHALGLNKYWLGAEIVNQMMEFGHTKNETDVLVLKSLAWYILEDDTCCSNVAASTHMDPRQNWVYYQVLLDCFSYINTKRRIQSQETTESNLDDASSTDSIRVILSTLFEIPDKYVQCFGDINAQSEALRKLFQSVATEGTRTRDLALLCLESTMLNVTNSDVTPDGALFLKTCAYIKQWSTKNPWLCYLDFKLVLTPELSTMVLENEKIADLGIKIQIGLYNLVQGRLPQDFTTQEMKEKLLDAVEGLLTQGSRMTSFYTTAIVQFLCAEEHYLSALALIDKAQVDLGDSCGALHLYKALVSAKIECFDPSVQLTELGLRNIQLDTMFFLIHDALITGYHMSALYSQCDTATTFYRKTLDHELPDTCNAALGRGSWVVLLKQLDIVRKKFRFSIRRAECLVLGILAGLENVNSSRIVTYLQDSKACYQTLVEIEEMLKDPKTSWCANENQDVLEPHVWDVTKLAPQCLRMELKERVDYLKVCTTVLSTLLCDSHAVPSPTQLESCLMYMKNTHTVNVQSLQDAVRVIFPRTTLAYVLLHLFTSQKRSAQKTKGTEVSSSKEFALGLAEYTLDELSRIKTWAAPYVVKSKSGGKSQNNSAIFRTMFPQVTSVCEKREKIAQVLREFESKRLKQVNNSISQSVSMLHDRISGRMADINLMLKKISEERVEK